MSTEPSAADPTPEPNRQERRERRRLKLLRMRPMRTVAILPTLFTLGNLVCGFFAIVVAARIGKPLSDALPLPGPEVGLMHFDSTNELSNCMLSAWLIFLAMIFDALDGHVARLAHSTSDFGAQLDSLCDAVTFGVAPGFLMVKMCPNFTYLYPHTPWIIAATYTACAVMRLARFNVETGQDDDHSKFSGLPSPAAAGSVAGFAIFFYTLQSPESVLPWKEGLYTTFQHVLPWFTLLVAALMVSRIPYPHIVNQIFSGRRSFAHLVGVVFALVAVMAIRGYAIPIVAVLFVLGPPVRFLWRKWHEAKAEEPFF